MGAGMSNRVVAACWVITWLLGLSAHACQPHAHEPNPASVAGAK